MQIGDRRQVRKLLIEAISRGGSADIEVITYAIESTPDLFDRDDGKVYPEASEMTPPHVAALREDLKENFSIPKLQLLTDLYGLINADMEPTAPGTRAPRASETSADESADSSALSESEHRDMEDYGPREPHSGSKAGRVVGYLLILLGVAAVVVGVSVPVNFLIGVGIGVIMLGAAVVYMSIKS